MFLLVRVGLHFCYAGFQVGQQLFNNTCVYNVKWLLCLCNFHKCTKIKKIDNRKNKVRWGQQSFFKNESNDQFGAWFKSDAFLWLNCQSFYIFYIFLHILTWVCMPRNHIEVDRVRVLHTRQQPTTTLKI